MLAPRVLVADDNPPSLRFLEAALHDVGCLPLAVADGVAACEAAAAATFDLLLLDARMPRLGGADALARIRGGGGPSCTAVAIATTAAPEAEVRAALLAAGFAEVLHKPLGLAQLRTALVRHLPTQGQADELDDARALAAAGGDRAIVDALRGLLAGELDALPAEIAALSARRDADGLRDRLHRLDASAGFCGMPALAVASAHLRAALAASPWPDDALASFLSTCAALRGRLPQNEEQHG